MKILFIGKKGDEMAIQAADYLIKKFPESILIFGSRGEPKPEAFENWEGDFVFSYLSQWILPEDLLSRAKVAAINWHPGPPEYPGIGCSNFAHYNDEKQFGITCHHMLARVDTGKIIEVRRFDREKDESVFSMTQKCYKLIYASFCSIIDCIAEGKEVPISKEEWKRKPYTRKELDALSEINPQMPANEIAKRIAATTYDKPWAFVDIKGYKFYYRG